MKTLGRMVKVRFDSNATLIDSKERFEAKQLKNEGGKTIWLNPKMGPEETKQIRTIHRVHEAIEGGIKEKKLEGSLEKKGRDRKVLWGLDTAVWMFKNKIKWGGCMRASFWTEKLEEFEAFALS